MTPTHFRHESCSPGLSKLPQPSSINAKPPPKKSRKRVATLLRIPVFDVLRGVVLLRVDRAIRVAVRLHVPVRKRHRRRPLKSELRRAVGLANVCRGRRLPVGWTERRSGAAGLGEAADASESASLKEDLRPEHETERDRVRMFLSSSSFCSGSLLTYNDTLYFLLREPARSSARRQACWQLPSSAYHCAFLGSDP